MDPAPGPETPLNGSLPPPLAPPRVPEPRAAVLFVAGIAVLFFWGALAAIIAFGEAGLTAAEWLLLLVPAILFVRRRGYDVTSTLSLRRPSVTAVIAGLFLAAGALPLGWGLAWVQTFVLPLPVELLQGLEEQLTAETPGRLVWLLFAMAVTPALCEEVVFRGVLLGGTRSLAPWRVVVLNGVVFGVFHLSFETVIRFLPTAWLGIVIAWAVLRSGSLWIGVLMHFLNNATIVFLASAPAAQDAVSDPNAPPPVWAVLTAVVALSLGAAILGREDARSRATSPTSHP